MRDITSAEINVQAHHSSIKKLGHWTTSRVFEVRADHGSVVLDLRSPGIEAGDIEVTVALDASLLKILVPDGAVIDHWDLRGRVKDAYGSPAPGGRVIRLRGNLHRSEIRVHRGGIAILSAMASREFLEDAYRAHKNGTQPTVADPAAVQRS
jgi:hypothetical protein